MELCIGCLSSNRRLIDLASIQQILTSGEMFLDLKNLDMFGVCWECRSIITKFISLKNQIHFFQNELETIIQRVRNNEELPCASRLSEHVNVYNFDVITLGMDFTDQIDSNDISKESHFNVENGVEIKMDNASNQMKYINSQDKLDEVMDNDSSLKNVSYRINDNINESSNEIDADISEIKYNVNDYKHNANSIRNLSYNDYTIKYLTIQELKKKMEFDRHDQKYATAPYKCNYCVKVFDLEGSYEEHTKKHVKKNGFLQCAVCMIYIQDKKQLDFHYQGHFRSFICNYCNFSNNSVGRLAAHMHTHKKVCKHCGQTFKILKQLIDHQTTVHRVECPLCDTIFNTQHQLKEHLRSRCGYIESWDFKCGLCDERHKNVDSLRDHLLKAHQERKGATCQECGEFKGDTVNRCNHLVEQGRQSIIICDVCGLTFTNLETLDEHFQQKHTDDCSSETIRICEYCGDFFEVSKIEKHIEEQHEMKSTYTCSTCGATFGTYADMSRHLITEHKMNTNRELFKV